MTAKKNGSGGVGDGGGSETRLTKTEVKELKCLDWVKGILGHTRLKRVDEMLAECRDGMRECRRKLSEQ